MPDSPPGGERAPSPAQSWTYWPPYPKDGLQPRTPPPKSPALKSEDREAKDDDGHGRRMPSPPKKPEPEPEPESEEEPKKKEQGIPAWAAADAPTPWPAGIPPWVIASTPYPAAPDTVQPQWAPPSNPSLHHAPPYAPQAAGHQQVPTGP